MSWSIDLIGKPEALKKALDAESARLTGTSKAEFDAAKPGLDALLDCNRGTGNYSDGSPVQAPTLHLVAAGHAYREDKAAYGSCNVELTSIGSTLVS